MNILQIVPQGEMRSGAAIQMYRLSKSLEKKGHKLFLIFRTPNEISKEDFTKNDMSGLNVTFMDLDRVKLNMKTLKSIKELRKFIINNKIDVVHSHKGSTNTLCVFAMLGLNIPVIANRGVINPLNFFNGLKYRTKFIDRTVAVSQVVKDVMVKTGSITPSKIDVIYGGVDIEIFKPGLHSTIREEYNISKDMFVIGFAGNAGPRKGLIYLAEAFKKIAEKHKEIVLIMVGVSEADKDKFRFNDEIKKRVYALGFRHDVANCMSGMDMFVFSGVAEEGLTGTVREAAAIGLPIITTDVAGNRELIKDDETGLVVPMKDSIALEQAIEKIVGDKEKADRYGKNARKFVEENMSNEIRAEKIEKLYLEVISKRGAL